ncbi:hypothetical protein EMIT0158MI4_60410 [Burkholderia ambifaria]
MRNAPSQQEHWVLFRSLQVRYAGSACNRGKIIGKHRWSEVPRFYSPSK